MSHCSLFIRLGRLEFLTNISPILFNSHIGSPGRPVFALPLYYKFKYIHSPSRVPAIMTNDCACNHLSSGSKHKMKITRWRIGGESIKTNNEGVIFLSFLFLG